MKDTITDVISADENEALIGVGAVGIPFTINKEGKVVEDLISGRSRLDNATIDDQSLDVGRRNFYLARRRATAVIKDKRRRKAQQN